MRFSLRNPAKYKKDYRMHDTSIDKYGLAIRDLETIRSILMKYPEVETVHIFGSRAMGNHKPGSDIDLAIINKGVNPQTIAQIKSDFEDSSLPFRVDILSYPELRHENLKNHIDRVSALLYSSGSEKLKD